MSTDLSRNKVVRKNGSEAIRLEHHGNFVGQVLVTTVDPVRLGIIALDFRDENGNSHGLGVMKGDPKDEEELSDFVNLVMSHLEKRCTV